MQLQPDAESLQDSQRLLQLARGLAMLQLDDEAQAGARREREDLLSHTKALAGISDDFSDLSR